MALREGGEDGEDNSVRCLRVPVLVNSGGAAVQRSVCEVQSSSGKEAQAGPVEEGKAAEGSVDMDR
jgi:hypothetical protein